MDASLRARLAPWVAASVGVALYLNTLPNGFVFDDIFIVQENPSIRSLREVPALFTRNYWYPQDSWDRLYRPFTVASYSLNHALAGLRPWAWHLGNALLHGLVVLLLHAAVLPLAGRGGAFLAALLFAAHPIHTEAVASVVGRAELLAAAFSLGALLAHARGHAPAVAGLLTLAASLSKESALATPGLLLLWDFLRPGRLRPRWASVVASLAAALVAVAARRAALGTFLALPPADPEMGLLHHESLATRLPTALHVLGRYWLLLVKPWPLCADYSYNQIPLVRSMADGFAVLGLVGLVALVAAVPALRRRAPDVALGAGVVVLGLALTANLVVPIGTLMAERLLFLPSAGLCLALGSRLARAGRAGWAAALLLAALGAALTVVRNRDWRDQFGLFEATAKLAPRSVKINVYLGRWMRDRDRLDEAEACLRRVRAVAPESRPAHDVLGDVLFRKGAYAEAAGHFEWVARRKPADALSRYNLGECARKLGDPSGAERAYREALERDPSVPTARYALGTLLCETGRWEAGLRELETAARLQPDEGKWRYGLALALEHEGRREEAEREFREAERLGWPGAERPRTPEGAGRSP
jgi:tetratricopeptide (TPR) repeat protein